MSKPYLSFHLLMDIWLFSEIYGSAMNIVCTCLFRQMFQFFLDKYLWMELLGDMFSVCLTLEETSKVVSEVVVPFYMLTSVYHSFSSYTPTHCFKAEQNSQHMLGQCQEIEVRRAVCSHPESPFSLTSPTVRK